MRRLFWLNVAAVVLFAGLAAFHYSQHRKAMAWLALAAAFMFLWNAVSISEFHAELVHLREEVGDYEAQMADLAAAAGVDDEEDEGGG